MKESQWKIFVGDKVEVVGGLKDVGKRGIVLDVHKSRNRLTVEGINMVIKHIKPNPEMPKGNRVSVESPIKYHKVKVIDETLDVPTNTSLVKFKNEAKQRNEWTRLSHASQTYIKIPEKKDKFKDRAVGPMDTPASLVSQITWTPNILECPFPVRLMNQLERLKRNKNEAKGL